ncbi:MAG TPA: glutathione S-transferase family protein [Ensifer sp.]|nr:glutathione S-transferase family protein [Ensifer sp.]
MVTLYGDASRTRANRCTFMLKELGIDYDYRPVAFHPGQDKPADFLALNPNGKCPTLVDGDLILFESLAINLYLARTYRGLLGPQTPQEDALMQQWSFWVATEVEKPLLLTAAVRHLFDPQLPEEGETDITLAKLKRPWSVLDAHLRDREFVLGDRFSVADINLSAVMHFIPIADIDISAWPSFERWLKACLARPAADDLRSVAFRVPRPRSSRDIFAMFV